MSRRYIATNPSRPFSDAVLIDGRTLYLSGRIGLKPGVDQVPDSIEEEAHLVMKDLQRILAAAEMHLEHLVFLQVFSPDVALWAPFNEVYRLYFSGPMPPRSFIGSGPLLFGARFELQGIAIKDDEAKTS
ncbi:MAG: Rid family hydrolase [Terracidiphilus sp.]|jgi:enamine deaminase RidA (YjgF/YER057c/UK114 family)